MTRFLPASLVLLALCGGIAPARAQFGYTYLTATSATYTPLDSGATTVSTTTPWDDDDFTIALPFSFKMNGKTMTTVYFTTALAQIANGVSSTAPIAVDSFNGFSLIDVDIADRGKATSAGPSLSPVRYRTTGSTPNRICKIEVFNAGFFDEYDSLSTMNDSANMQVWLYETSNKIELRYGPSRVSYPSTYYDFGSGPFAGQAKIDISMETGKVYHLEGPVAAPTLDSFTISAAAGVVPSGTLSSWPASGTVYTFIPLGGATGLGSAVAAARSLRLYPTAAGTTLTADWAGAGGEPYQIVSAAGAVAAEGTLRAGRQEIGVASLAPGTYLLRLRGGAHRFTKL